MKDNQELEGLKAKGLTDYAGHYVTMLQVDKDKKEYYHWSDGAITPKGFQRDRIFNFAYSLIRFWKLNKILIKISLIVFSIMFVIYILNKIF